MSIKYENDRMTGKDLDTYNKKKTYKNKMAPVQSRASDFRKQNRKWPRLGNKDHVCKIWKWSGDGKGPRHV